MASHISVVERRIITYPVVVGKSINEMLDIYMDEMDTLTRDGEWVFIDGYIGDSEDQVQFTFERTVSK